MKAEVDLDRPVPGLSNLLNHVQDIDDLVRLAPSFTKKPEAREHIGIIITACRRIEARLESLIREDKRPPRRDLPEFLTRGTGR